MRDWWKFLIKLISTLNNSVKKSASKKMKSAEWDKVPPKNKKMKMKIQRKNLNKLKQKLQGRTHGLTSEQLSRAANPNARIESGAMAACINYDYERDYIMESLMQDKMLQAKRARKKSFDMRKTTKAQEGQLIATKKRIENIKLKEASAHTAVDLVHRDVRPVYYPMKQI